MLRYIPAHLPGTFENTYFQNKTLKWWEKENPFFTYPYLLISSYHALEKKWSREKNVKNKDVVVFGDSGGFQQISKQIEIEPIRVLKWLENNCDVGFTLDYPPFEFKSGVNVRIPVSKQKFEWCLKKTIINNKIYEKYRSNNSNLKIYNVVHGPTIERLSKWYESVKDFNGYGFATGGVKPVSNSLMQVVSPMFLYDKGFRGNLHIFGLSGIDVTLSMAYLSKHFSNLTYDSSTYAKGKTTSVAIHPYTLRFSFPFGNREQKSFSEKLREFKFEKIPCDCEVCKIINKNINIEKFYEQISSKQTSLLSLHNLNILIKFNNFLNIIVKNEPHFRRFVKFIATNPDNVFDSFDFIDMVVEKGFDKAYDKFKNKLNHQIINYKNSSLYNF